ncbi:MAG: hypothetical protein LQ346_002678 [Caloplaca aetnensis]|nr:MAG: hypothetical protein LQ346_002678 [Caloplaca aetnensis]
MPSHTTKSTPVVHILKRDPFFTPRRPAPPPPSQRNWLATFTASSTLIVQPLATDPFFIPRRPAPPIPRRSRYFGPDNPTLAVERAMSAAEKAEVWAMAVEQAFAGGLRWTLRKNRKRLHINSNIVEEKVTDGSITVGF